MKLPEASSGVIRDVDLELGAFIGEAIRDFIGEYGLSPGFIASHGHTVFHDPAAGITLQIGNGEEIAGKCGIMVVNDFRSQDVGFGGQGAPLVPVGDRLLFGQYDACLNLGGIANISYEENGRRMAFDICPANMVLNMLAGRAGKAYDDRGMMAKRGSVITELLEELESLPYYAKKGARSLGREWVEGAVFPLIGKYGNYSIPDLLATFTEHIAKRTGTAYSQHGKKMLVTGGGAHNDQLVSRIRHHSAAGIILPDPLIIDYKEALVFAFLGLLRIKGINNVLASVTGAPHDHCAGRIHHP
jgi:anhydro-N-acetylmuramic acid kinase